ncbi:AlpA family transcriptional regulator [Edaphobacter sp. HDX4]|uniref:helix-turn-helix transcriptional regulator n=1 Tax=Edaphobacter sp. HDX4 TaxID=2794064 RepID=UPI002FE67CC9
MAVSTPMSAIRTASSSTQAQESRPAPKKKFLRLPTIIETTGLSRSTIYRKLDDGNFPRPVRLGPKSVAWIESEVQDWMDQLASSRDMLRVG